MFWFVCAPVGPASRPFPLSVLLVIHFDPLGFGLYFPKLGGDFGLVCKNFTGFVLFLFLVRGFPVADVSGSCSSRSISPFRGSCPTSAVFLFLPQICLAHLPMWFWIVWSFLGFYIGKKLLPN